VLPERLDPHSPKPDLIGAIGDYINHHNSEPKSFIWNKNAADILGKVTRARRALDKSASV